MRKKKGFSLLEVLVAIDILAMALFFIIGLIPFDNASVKQDAHIQVATRLGEELLESISAFFYNDGTDESGVPEGSVLSEWDGFTKTVSIDGSVPATPGIYCPSSTCPSGTTQDTLDEARPANTLFPPYPYAPACASPCTSVSNYGSIFVSTTSDGVPDSRQYYFYVTIQPYPSGSPDPDFRFVQVIVFWYEQARPGASSSGPLSWQQAGYRNITLSSIMLRRSGP